MTTKKTLLIGSAVVIFVCFFAYGYLSYSRTSEVNYTPDQEKQMLLPLLLIYYKEADTPANRAKYDNLSADDIKSILNEGRTTDIDEASGVIYL